MRKLSFSLILGFAIPAIGYGQTVIPIQNPSFEQLPKPLPLSSPCGPWAYGDQRNWYAIPGWTFSAASGVIQPNNPNTYFSMPVPDGLNVAYAENATIMQDTGVKASDVQANAGPTRSVIYTMIFSVTDRYPPYPGHYEAKIGLGFTDAQGVIHMEHELCPLGGWSLASWEKITLVCLSPGYVIYDNWPAPANPVEPSDPSYHLIISLSAAGWDLLFDKVSLTFIPTN